MVQVELTILMPCLNEAGTVGACVLAARDYLRRSGVSGEILVADNGSTDGSRELAQQAGARVIQVARRGYGAALIEGIAAARGQWVVMGDADCSYDFSELEPFVERLRAGCDLVMGNRFQGGIQDGAMPTLHRYLGNPVLSFIGRLFFKVPIGDFHCGLRAFRREAILGLDLVTPGMEFASEMIAKAALAHLRIAEVPTVLRPDGRDRPPHLRTWRDGWRHLRFLLLFCPRWLFLYPGLAMFALGMAGFALLQPQALALPSFGLDIHSLLYMAAAVILGVQWMQLGLLTQWVGVMAGIVPEPAWMSRLRRIGSVELGLVLGAGLFLLGLAWSVELTRQWSASRFGSLDPRVTMRAAIPAVTLMILGVQAAAAALFGGALRLSWASRGRDGRNERKLPA